MTGPWDVAANFDGHVSTDLAWVNQHGRGVTVLRNRGNGGFKPAPTMLQIRPRCADEGILQAMPSADTASASVSKASARKYQEVAD